ncbi:MAG: hypothetical protein ACTS6J_18325 [Burkholderiales bacterium]
MADERAVIKGDGNLETMRTIGMPRASGMPRAPLKPRWRTDSNIFERARGAAIVAARRQYELSLDLAEAGIKPGVPFVARLEIEGGPVRIEKKTYGPRPLLGRAGSPDSPLWLRIGG